MGGSEYLVKNINSINYVLRGWGHLTVMIHDNCDRNIYIIFTLS